MRIELSSEEAFAVKTDLLAVPLWEGKSYPAELSHIGPPLKGYLTEAWKKQKFSGKEGTILLLPTLGLCPAEHILLVGMGKKGKVEDPVVWRQKADVMVREALRLKAKSAAWVLSDQGEKEKTIAALTEGCLLSAYRFDHYKSDAKKNRKDLLQKVILLGHDFHTLSCRRAQRLGELFAEATCYARDLTNLPAAVVTPDYLGKEAQKIGRAEGLKVRVYTKEALEKLGMGAILGVAQGSVQGPCLIEMGYRPSKPAKRRIALVGKGVTFDSGGLSLKTPQGMEAMKRDMAGGAVVLGVMKVVERLAPAVEVWGYVPASENLPSGSAYKPGDILKTYSGRTVEVLNTDAEGRLLLADALAYACSSKGRQGGDPPDAVIDVATLTGAVRVALGNRVGGILGTDPSLVRALIEAGKRVGEELWELPLFAPYREQLESPVADLKNIGGGGGAGTILAALFLKEFVPAEIPWAHLDIAGVAFTDTPLPCIPRGATGFAVRTLLQYLWDLDKT